MPLADAIELRGRWDAEVVARAGGTPSAALKAALKRYDAATNEIVKKMGACAPDERVCSMSQHPRMTRYKLMREVYGALYTDDPGAKLDPKLAFSCVNLSYDYSDSWDTCDLGELDATAAILHHACLSCFSGALTQKVIDTYLVPEAPQGACSEVASVTAPGGAS
eukprot:6505258-Prymnesium_polylepis.1